MAFEMYFLIGFISKINEHSFGEKISFIYFNSINVKGNNWADLAEKNS